MKNPSLILSITFTVLGLICVVSILHFLKERDLSQISFKEVEIKEISRVMNNLNNEMEYLKALKTPEKTKLAIDLLNRKHMQLDNELYLAYKDLETYKNRVEFLTKNKHCDFICESSYIAQKEDHEKNYFILQKAGFIL